MPDQKITKEHVFAAAIADRPGALAEKLAALRDGGLDLEFIILRRDQPGRQLMFISPLRTVSEIEVAKSAGLTKAEGLHALRVAGPNEPGLGAKIADALAGAKVNIRGLSAAALGGQQVTNLAFDSADDAQRAKTALEAALNR
jgi:hypothetical protein